MTDSEKAFEIVAFHLSQHAETTPSIVRTLASFARASKLGRDITSECLSDIKRIREEAQEYLEWWMFEYFPTGMSGETFAVDGEEYEDEMPFLEDISEYDADLIIDLMIDGANPNTTSSGNPLLMLASAADNMHIVNTVLDHGGDPDIRDTKGRTSLMRASMYGHQRIVSRLLAAGADPNARDSTGETALHKAAMSDAPVSDLLASGANPNVRDNGRETPLMIATSNGHTGLVNELLAAGARPYKPRRSRKNPKMPDGQTVYDLLIAPPLT